MKHNVRTWNTSNLKKLIPAGVLAFAFLAVTLSFFITRTSTQGGAEIAYTDTSVLENVAGSVVPASCDSNDWRGSYCNATLDTSDCHANATLSFCPTTGLSCEYQSAGVYPHSGSHFANDCLTRCPGSTNAYYDPYNDPNMLACPNIKVRFGKNCTTPWGETVITGDSRRAWQASSASTCVAETRTCTNGQLSGSYAYASCTKTTTGGSGGGGTGCFVAGTKITLANGAYKNIEDVTDTDQLMSSSGPVAIEKRLRINYEGQIYAFNGDGNYFVTPTHPFMTSEGWKSIDPVGTLRELPDLKVSKLTIGDTLILENGKTVELTQLDSKYEKTVVYNFKLGGNHEYYADGFLVHNKLQY